MSLTVEASGTGPLTYTWTVPEENNATILDSNVTITSLSTEDSGAYSVEVSGACGTAQTSLTTTLDVGVTTDITVQPTPSKLDYCDGESVTLEVEAVGTDLTYEWTFEGTVITGATTSTLDITDFDSTQAGTYVVTVSGRCNPLQAGVSSVDVPLTYNAATLITVEPQDQQACAASNASFGVTATGQGVLTYQWYNSAGTVLTNETGSTLTFDPTSTSDAGDYYVEVTGTCGTETSELATLAITDTEVPSVTLAASATEVCEGEEITFTASGSATGADPLYVFTEVGGSELQASSSNNEYINSGRTTDITVEVEMTSNSQCIDPSASAVVTAEVTVTVVPTPTLEIDVPTTDAIYLTATDDVTLGATSNTNISWTLNSGQGTLGNLTGTSTDLTGLTEVVTDPTNPTGDGVTEITATAQDVNATCDAVTDQITLVRVDVTQPVLEDGEFCSTDLPYDVQGNAYIDVVNPTDPTLNIEIPTMTDVDDALGNGANYEETSNVLTITSPVITTTEDSKDFTFVYEIENTLAGTTLSDDAVITIHEEPSEAEAGADITTCSESVNLGATAPDYGVGTWSCDGGLVVSDVNDPSAQVSGLETNETYTCTWTVSNGTCVEKVDAVTLEKVGDVTTPVIYFGGIEIEGTSVDICISDVIGLTASMPQSTEQGTWGSVGTSITGVGAVDANATDQGTLTLASEGTTTLSWTIDNPSIPSCVAAVKTVDVTVHAEPLAGLTVAILDTCSDIAEIGVTTAALGSTDTLVWSGIEPSAGSSTTSWTIVGSQLSEGINTITYSVGNPGCTAEELTETIMIEEVSTPSVSLSSFETQCVGTDLTFVASAENGGTDASYNFTYSEQNGGLPLGASSSNTVTLLDLPESEGTVNVELTSSLRCVTSRTAEATVDLEVVPGPSPEIVTASQTICEDSPIEIEGEDTGDNPSGLVITYQLKLDGDVLLETTDKDAILYTGAAESGEYTLTADNGVCDEVESAGMDLDVREVPEVSALGIDGSETIVAFSDSVITIVGTSTGLSSEWSAVSDSITITDNSSDITTVTSTAGGIYYLVFTSTDGPCEASDSVELVLRVPIMAPNVFTPNGDGDHETFQVAGIETYQEATVSIYNRWGVLIYEADDYPNNEWDADGVVDGVYYFVIDLNDGTGESHSGVVHVIRSNE